MIFDLPRVVSILVAVTALATHVARASATKEKASDEAAEAYYLSKTVHA